MFNFTVLKKRGGKPQVGDVFVMLPPDGLFLYGRVIATDARIGPMENCILIYIYRARSKRKDLVPELLRGQFLVPPIMTNALPWTRGYFEVLENREIRPLDKLRKHCFKNSFGRYFDEYNNSLPSPVDPIGAWGLSSLRTIDDEVSNALGIPLAPDDTKSSNPHGNG